jgi:hypothetical protein
LVRKNFPQLGHFTARRIEGGFSTAGGWHWQVTGIWLLILFFFIFF